MEEVEEVEEIEEVEEEVLEAQGSPMVQGMEDEKEGVVETSKAAARMARQLPSTAAAATAEGRWTCWRSFRQRALLRHPPSPQSGYAPHQRTHPEPAPHRSLAPTVRSLASADLEFHEAAPARRYRQRFVHQMTERSSTAYRHFCAPAGAG